MLLANVLPVVALAATTVLADGKAITAAMATIKADTVQLGASVSSLAGDLLDVLTVLPIAGESLGLLADIKKGAEVADKSAPLTQDEALGLASVTVDLAAQVNKTLEILIAAKPKFDGLLVVSPIIFLNLEAQREATTDFGNKVVAKVPKDLQAIAKGLMQPIDDGFNEVIAAYQIKLL
ncbi:Uncharacterized protein TCAP_00951 [Tolypocladium capitatum]|uniref:Antigenic cell wall galactomannoprotein n=1 Tax=Tolypocladium capitatum TaxID=45235 RepID=A0A2K3QNK7_9HYPO|nr:Uncharacterized protein TCAP_00951 [Tolypocladium capitatum]